MAKELFLSENDGCKVQLSGQAKDANFTIADVSNCNAAGFIVNNVDANLMNSSILNIYAKETLKTFLSDNSILNYKGNPVITKMNSGDGSVKKI